MQRSCRLELTSRSEGTHGRGVHRSWFRGTTVSKLTLSRVDLLDRDPPIIQESAQARKLSFQRLAILNAVKILSLLVLAVPYLTFSTRLARGHLLYSVQKVRRDDGRECQVSN